jgi:aldose 1-epimerase
MRFAIAAFAASMLGTALARPDQPHPDAQGRYTLEAEGIKAQFIPYGATLTNLWVKGRIFSSKRRVASNRCLDKKGVQRDIVLGYDNTTYYGKLPPNR